MIGTILSGRYEVLEAIGEGGMAITYRARDVQLNRDVAVKVLREQYVNDAEFVERFRREAQSAASLSHPNIATVYDIGKHDNSPFIVMELVSGPDLAKVLKASGPLAIEQAVSLASQVASALEHAHANGLVHRDIKPANLLIPSPPAALQRAGEGGGVRVKVTDFGIARTMAAEKITTDQSILGTANYLSPEQAKGEPAVPASDLYSLGAVLFEMLTGRALFDGETPVAVAVKHVNERAEAPSRWRREVPSALDRIVLKCLHKNPNERYTTARALLDELTAVSVGAPVSAAAVANNDSADFNRTQVIPGAAVAAAPTSDDSWRDRTGIFTPPLAPAAAPRPAASAVRAPPRAANNSVALTVMLVLLLAVVLGGGGAVIYVMNSGGVTAVVPDVLRVPLAEARKALAEQGLRVGKVDHEANTSIPVDCVIRQTPTAGEHVPRDTEVRLVVSKGEEIKLTEVPDVTQMTLNRAKQMIADASLKLGEVREEPDSKIAAGQVLSQSPEAGTRIEVGEKSKVNLVVSKGPDKPPVDDRPTAGTVEYTLPEEPAQQQIKVIVIDSTGKRTVHDETHPAGYKLALPITGKGKVKVKVLNSDQLVDEWEFEPEN